MIKNFTFLLILITFPFSNGFSLSNETRFDFSDDISIIESMLFSSPIGEHSLSVFFDISANEFDEYIDNNSVETITLDFYWQNDNGNYQEFIGSEVIHLELIQDITQWTYLIENADYLTGKYFVQFTINEEDCGLIVPIPLEEIDNDDDDDIDLPINLPDFDCGETFTLDPVTNTNALNSASIGNVFYIGGFPILLTDVTGGSGMFSGAGIIPLPFKNKAVQVSFSDVNVNTDNIIYVGEVIALSNGGGFIPTSDTLDIGGEICLSNPPAEGYGPGGYDEVTGLDEWGFDSLGIHSETQTTFNPDGFDVNGNHVNGTPYNDAGCDRNGVNDEGEPCDPSAGSNAAASAFADSLSTNFLETVTDYINDLIEDAQDSIEALNCTGIRTEMTYIVDTSGFIRKFVFGIDDKYFKKGMHLSFNQVPETIGFNIARVPGAEALEERHVDLFICDKKEYALDTILIVLNSLDANSINETILNKIKNWTEYEYNLYSGDSEKFSEWVLRQVGDIVKEESGLVENYFYSDNSINDILNKTTPAFIENLEYNDIVTADISGLQVGPDDYSPEEKEIYSLLESAGKAQIRKKYQEMPPGLTDSMSLLPIIVKKSVGNKTYKIVIHRIVFMPSGAKLDAYIEIEDPETNKKLVFAGTNIPLGPTGFSSDEASRLYLGNPVQVRLNNVSRLILKQGPGTYVSWNCNGFSGMGVDAEIEFCRNYIIPLDENLEITPDSVRYKLPLQIDVPSWLEFSLTIPDAPPFVVAGYEDVKWVLTGMVVDFSSASTPEFQPMDGYASPFWDGNTMSPAWKGFYMKQLSATLPKALSGGNDTSEVTISAVDILIDNRGFTGGVEVENVINIDNGNMSGWPFSIDYFELRILNNSFAGAGLGGAINVPIFEENFDYTATMYPNSIYEFAVYPDSVMTANLFIAEAHIDENSSISISYDGSSDEFVAIATLNGHLSVKADTTKLKIKLPDVTFQNFKVSNGKGGNSYFSAGTWGISSEGNSVGLKVGGFGISLGGIGLYNPSSENAGGSERAGLKFIVDVSLVEKLKINASGGLGIEGIMQEDDNGRQKWVYDKIILKHLEIDATLKGGTEIYGLLEWYEDGDYDGWGSGFRGLLDAKFKKLGLGLQAAAQFGKTEQNGEEFKYFFVDAMADLGSIASIGPLKIKGFGGGVSYHMDSDVSQVNLAAPASNNQSLPPIGSTFSETVYSPDINMGLGLKASALITLQKEELFNGSVSIVFKFYSNESEQGGGLKSIALTGQGQFLKGVDLGIASDFPDDTEQLDNKPNVSAPLSAYINLTMNFDEPAFDGTLYAFLDAGPLKGAGQNNKLVNATIHFDKNDWYIWIGTPTDRCGMKFGVLGINASATAYFEVGTKVHSMPELPANVQSIAYKVNKNEALRSSGAGFMLGASFDIDIHGGIKNIVEASLQAGVGFDLMLRKMDGVTCDGEQIGINGWYAAGQMWAYAEGSLDVFGVNVASAGIAAVLQMRGPKPFFAQATVGVKVKILLVTVEKSLSLELGNDCNLVSTGTNPALGMEAITYVLPTVGEEFVNTFSNLKAAFPIGIGTSLEMSDGTNVANYRIEVNSILVTDGNENEISNSLKYNQDKTIVNIIPDYELPSSDSITLTVVVDVYQNGTIVETESKSTTFFTDKSYDIIPNSNISAAYPANGMANFYKEEYTKHEGFIKLVKGQCNLLCKNNVQDGYTQKIKFSTPDGQSFYADYEYDYFEKTITFPMDPSKFVNDEMYKLEFVRLPLEQDVEASTAPIGMSSLGMAMSGTTALVQPPLKSDNNAEGDFESNNVLYKVFFRVSSFNSFNQKMAAIEMTGPMSKNITSVENFDETEIDKGLVKLSNFNSAPHWFTKEARPKLESLINKYRLATNCQGDYCNSSTFFSSLRKNAISLNGNVHGLNITSEVFNSGNFNINSHQQNFVYFLEPMVIQKVEELFSALVVADDGNNGGEIEDVDFGGSTPLQIEDFMPAPIYCDPFNLQKCLPVTVNYYLPGGVKTSTYTVDFNSMF